MSIAAPTLKTCRMCDETQIESEFYVDKRERDGRRSECKSCLCMRGAANRQAKLEHYRNYDRQRSVLPHRHLARRQYAASERGKEVRNASVKKWSLKFPEKYKAESLLRKAVAKGSIKKLPCEVCGRTDRIHGHHDDYAKPLEVRWLCATHHAAHHKHLRAVAREQRAT